MPLTPASALRHLDHRRSRLDVLFPVRRRSPPMSLSYRRVGAAGSTVADSVVSRSGPTIDPTSRSRNLSKRETVVQATPMPKLAPAVALACLLPSTAVASPVAPARSATASAVRAPEPVVIDGRADDAIWRTAPVIAD